MPCDRGRWPNAFRRQRSSGEGEGSVTRTRKEPSEEEVGVAKAEVEQGGMCPCWQRRKAEVRSRSAQAGGGWGSPAKVSAVELYAGEGKVAMGPPLASGYGWSDLATFAWSNSNQQGHNEVKSYPRGTTDYKVSISTCFVSN
uniref:Uncharacterized protein n=1 Tax=Oryza glumipatula TaxID=40148 RepID=A0A0D9Z252_9ORYZ